MKNTTFIFLFLLMTGALSAQDIKEVFSSSEATMEFVGLDFSKAKMVGTHGFENPNKIQNHYFNAWNGLFLTEKDKYDVRRAFLKRDMEIDLDIVEIGNDKVDFIDLVTNKTPNFFSLETIQKIVRNYDTKDMQADYGLSFVVHSFNKFQERAYIYVVIFDVKSKKVLFSEKMSGAAGGFGFRNYWAKSVYNILGDIRDYQFRTWKKKMLQSSGS